MAKKSCIGKILAFAAGAAAATAGITYYLKKNAGKKDMADDFEDFEEKFEDFAENAVDKTADTVSNAVDATKEFVSDVADKAEEITDEAAQVLKDTMNR